MAIDDAHIEVIKLREALELARQHGRDNGFWLYLPIRGSESDLSTDCFFHDTPKSAESDGDEEIQIGDRRFRPTIDVDSVEDCANWADRLSGKRDDQARMEIFNYYCRYDAFPETLGAPPPPSPDETRHLLDREWYDKLGPENVSNPCKHPNCKRGAVRFSAFCRPHHFESMMKRPSPFSD